MKNKVIDILKNNSQKSVIGFAVEEDDFDMVAQKLVKLFAIPGVAGQSEQLKPKPQICYKSNELCKYDCSGLCKESC